MDFDAALVEIERALAALQSAPVSLRAFLLYSQAITWANHGDVTEAVERLAEADAVSAPLADP